MLRLESCRCVSSMNHHPQMLTGFPWRQQGTLVLRPVYQPLTLSASAHSPMEMDNVNEGQISGSFHRFCFSFCYIYKTKDLSSFSYRDVNSGKTIY